MDLWQETRQLVTALEQRGLEYALVGAIALAIHGAPRATADIDLMVLPEDLEATLDTADSCGFTIAAMPMRFADGMEMRRVTKLSGDEALTLDVLLVDENLRRVWSAREQVRTEEGYALSVVSRQGLIEMKSWAGRDQDLADLRRLQELDR